MSTSKRVDDLTEMFITIYNFFKKRIEDITEKAKTNQDTIINAIHDIDTHIQASTAELSDQVNELKSEQVFASKIRNILRDEIVDLKSYQTTQFNDTGNLIVTRSDMLKYIHLFPYFIDMMHDEGLPIIEFLDTCLKNPKHDEFKALLVSIDGVVDDNPTIDLFEKKFSDFCKSVTLDDLKMTLPSTYKAVIQKFKERLVTQTGKGGEERGEAGGEAE